VTPSVSAIIVNHRSAAESADCVASLRRAFAGEGVGGEIVLVDCGSGPEEVARLSAIAADVFLPLPENRGYSGGINAGLARARGARLVLSNADVVFEPGG
jgi:GT2 family glycosyltransferase